MDKKLIFNGLLSSRFQNYLALDKIRSFVKILGDQSYGWSPLFLLIYLLYLARKLPFLKLMYSECVLLSIP
jgi:hypothetical protein